VLDPHLSGENSTEKTKRGKQADVWITDVKIKADACSRCSMQNSAKSREWDRVCRVCIAL